MVLDISFDDKTWRIVNFYNDVNDPSTLDTLLALDLNPTIPTLVTGNFNTHLHSWSPPNVTPSSWAEKLEKWAISYLLVLANEPGIITRQGVEHECDSTINLTWYNNAAIEDATFGNWTLDWAGSLGSDHTLTQVQGSLLCITELSCPDSQDLGFVINDEKAGDWSKHFKDVLGSPPLLPNKPTAGKVEELARCIHDAPQ